MDKFYPLVMKPGIQRDGTKFSTRNYTDGLWCRFQRGIPKKIGGYKSLYFFNGAYTNVPRGTIIIPYDETFHIYFGTSSNLYLIIIDENENVIAGPHDVTPLNFVASRNISWTFDFMFSADTDKIMIIAHPGYNLNNINNRTPSPIYFGAVGSTDKLTSTGQKCSGGIVVLNPYLMLLDNDGNIRRSAANKPNVFNTTLDGTPGTRITAQKLIAGRETRGGQNNPTGLIWSMDTLFRHSFNPQLNTFRTDRIGSSSLMSNNAIGELDNIFFWAGTDRFMYYNGVINQLINNNSLDFFFDNLNYKYREKVWCEVIPKFNEIRWHFPKGDSTECNWVVVLNKQEGSWYDTPIQRSCGYFDYSFNRPICLNYETPNGLNIFIHETGYDKKSFDVDGNRTIAAIQAYIETGDIAWCAIDPAGQFQGRQNLVNLQSLEPDFIQSGDILLSVKGRSYANGAESVLDDYPPITTTTLKVDIHTQMRELRLKFESNTLGGYFEMGNVLLNIVFGDPRP